VKNSFNGVLPTAFVPRALGREIVDAQDGGLATLQPGSVTGGRSLQGGFANSAPGNLLRLPQSLLYPAL